MILAVLALKGYTEVSPVRILSQNQLILALQYMAGNFAAPLTHNALSAIEEEINDCPCGHLDMRSPKIALQEKLGVA